MMKNYEKQHFLKCIDTRLLFVSLKNNAAL